MNGQNNEQKHRYLTLAIPIGAGLGVAIGLILSQMMDHPGFFAIGISIGLSIAIAIGVALDQRQ